MTVSISERDPSTGQLVRVSLRKEQSLTVSYSYLLLKSNQIDNAVALSKSIEYIYHVRTPSIDI